MNAARHIGAMLIMVLLAKSSALAGQPPAHLEHGSQASPHKLARVPQRSTPVLVDGISLRTTQVLFNAYVQDGKMPGIVGAFGVGDRPVQFVSAGRISTEPGAAAAGPDTIWRIYSMTKPVTGMAAMLLIEDGELSLDDPVAKYIPAFARMRVLIEPDTSLKTRPATKPITIRQLMTHTSGLGYQIRAKGPLLKEYERLGVTPFASDPEAEAVARRLRPTSLAAFAERAAKVPLVAEPGTAWNYSMGLDVLAAVIEKVSGMPFERFIRQRLLDPLGMTSTDWHVAPADVARFVTNYTFDGDRLVPFDPAATSIFLPPPSFPYGGAGLVSTARDYDRFLHMLQNEGTLDGVRVMKAETARLAMSNLMPAGVRFFGFEGNLPAGFGAGGMVYLENVPGGPSKGSFGCSGAMGTVAIVDTVHRSRSTIMVNYYPGEKWPLSQEVAAALTKDRFKSPP